MKLIIDIPEDVYTRLFDNGIQDNEIAVDDVCEMAKAIRKGAPLNEYIDKKFYDLGKCKCGSSYIVIDGETYCIDTGYAFEGIELFVNYIKGTLSKEKGALDDDR